MKKIIALAGMLLATNAFANIGIATNPHNLTNGTAGVCQYCHLPHNANPVGSAAGAPLWARSLRTTGIVVYSSTRLPSSTFNLDNNRTSLLCLSCHDGQATLGTLWTGVVLSFNPLRTIAARTLIGPTLTNDHPVGMAYPPGGTNQSSSGLATLAAATAAGYTFYGASNFIECASCHEPHIWSATSTDFSYKFKRQVTATDFCAGCHSQK